MSMNGSFFASAWWGSCADGNLEHRFDQGPCKPACSSSQAPYCHSHAAPTFKKLLLRIFFFLDAAMAISP